MEQLILYKVGQSLLHRGGMYNKKDRFITKWERHYKSGKSYYKVGQIIYYKLGQSLLYY